MRFTNSTRRTSMVAAMAAALVMASFTSAPAAQPAPGSPAPSGSNGGPLAPGVVTSKHVLHRNSASSVLPLSMTPGRAPSGGTPGDGGPATAPRSARAAFLLELAAPSTLSVYQQAVPRGKRVASSAARSQFREIAAAQSAVAAALPTGSTELYRTHSVLAGIAVRTDVANLSALKSIPGVAAVYPIVPKYPSNSYAVPLVGAPQAWTATGDVGAHSTIAVIDTGIDYTHANFGGPGTAAAYQRALAADASPADPALFPNAKIIDGYDFAGDAYDATTHPTPAPDRNPLDCEGHGSHVAGTAAGYGVTASGQRFAGPYSTATPFSSLRIGPGMAPGAKLLAYKVFGCTGSTDVVGEAIDRAADPNGDGDPSDHASVINMSLGSDFGSPQDADSVASNRASALGISVVVASGNGGDFYDVGGSPGNAVRTIGVANSVDASNVIDGLVVSAPAAIARTYGAERSVNYSWATKPDLAGVVAPKLSAGNEDGCDPLSPADAARVAGKIAFLEWTDNDTARRCGSVVRSGHVQVAGAVGFIFADDQETFAAGISGSALIPGVLVTKSAGDAIRAHLADGVTISGTVPNGVQQTFPQNNDKVNTSSSRGIRGAGNLKPDVTAVGTSVFSTAVGTGNQGTSETGTSMATPMVAGLSALVRSQHPDWTPEEVKADIMNTAGQDLFTGDNHTGSRYAPNRVGAGRIQADRAVDNTVLAFVKDDPGAVSVSFGPVAATGPTTLTKTVKVVNKGLSAVSYNIAYQALTTVGGVAYRVSTPTITVDRLSTRTFTVSLVIGDPRLMTKTIDPTVARSQGGLPREYVADASGRLVLTPTSGTGSSLRVPVYAAPRPASAMTASSSLTVPNGILTRTVLPLSGRGVAQGTGPYTIVSTLAGFELQAVSGLAPTCSRTVLKGCVHFPDERSADLKYVGVASNVPQLTAINGNIARDGLLYFSITTQGPWRTPAPTQEFDIPIDTNGDNVPDVYLFNTRLPNKDVFVSELVDIKTGDVLDIQPINDRFGDVDTALFDSDTLVMPVAISALPGVTAAKPRIHYGVAAFANDPNAPVDTIGIGATGNLAAPLSVDTRRPGVAIYGSYNASTSMLLFKDIPGTVLQLRKDRSAYQVDHGLGALVVHFHNQVGSKAQVVALKNAAAVRLALAPTRVKPNTRVTATVTVANEAGVPATGRVDLRRVGGAVVASGSVVNGRATVTFIAKTGMTTFRAEYHGDTNYLAANSVAVRLTVG